MLLDDRVKSAPPRSPSTSSIVSDIPNRPPKKRRASSSSLTDAENEDREEDEEDDDDDADEPLAARLTMGSRSVPGKRSGKQPPGKKTKKSHTLPGRVPGSNDDNGTSLPSANGKVNGIKGLESRIKLEEKMDEGQLSRLTAGVPIDAVGRSSAGVCAPQIFVWVD